VIDSVSQAKFQWELGFFDVNLDFYRLRGLIARIGEKSIETDLSGE
jgi:hypothetical protein